MQPNESVILLLRRGCNMIESIVKISNITESRLDPYYYNPKFLDFFSQILNIKHECLGNLINSITNGFDFRDYTESGIPYIKVANVKKGEFDFSKIQYVKFSSSDIAKQIQLKKGNILLTRKGTFGNVLYLTDNYDYVISSEVFYLDVKQDKINSKYLEIVLNSIIGQIQFDRNKIGAIMGSLSQEAVNQVKIPLFPEETQQKIVDIYNKANQRKRTKEQEAQQLLDGIDDYLLKELGIELPKNSRSKRYFEVNIQDLIGGRLDPLSYNAKYKSLRKMIQDSQVTKLHLKDIIIQSSAGDWGLDETEVVNEEYSKCLVIRSTEFENKHNLNIDNSRVKYRNIKTDKLCKMDIQTNDILIEKSGGSPAQPVGRVALLTDDIVKSDTLCYSNFIHKIRVDSSLVDSEYIYLFLKTIYNIGLTESMQSQTNGIRNLIMSEYFRQYILLPNKNKQLQVVNNIKNMQTKAKLLQKEAREILTRAKAEIEKMIIGG